VMRAMTPDSASPEQVRGEPITIAADVYALGVLLYRLVSGQSPYGSEQRAETELLRAICEIVPVPPLVARARASATPWSTRPFARDLDLIVLMALRKEPERRYGSAAQFADDVERFLGGRPVRAAPDSPSYRARKFLTRHRMSVAVAAIAVLAVLAGAAVAVYQSSVARRERSRAEQRFSDVRRMANSFMFEFHEAIADLPGSLSARKLVVTRAAGYLDGLAAEAHDDVTLQRELATANMRLADIMGGGGASNLGDIPGAETRYLRALTLFRNLTRRANPEPADVEGLAQLHVQMSRLAILKGDLGTAERSARDAVMLLQSHHSNGTVNIATAYHQLGFVQGRQGNNVGALESLGKATASARERLLDDPDHALAIARFARIATDYGDQLVTNGRPAEALNELEEARVQLDRLLQRDPSNGRHRQNRVYLLNLLAGAYKAQQRGADALAAHAEATSAAESMHAAARDDQGIQLALMMSRHLYAMAQIHAGAAADGIRMLRQAVKDGNELVKQAPTNAFAVNQLAAARIELGETLLKSDRRSREGCDVLGVGLQTWRDLEARGQLPGDAGQRRAELEALGARCRQTLR
jgi:tetratricopeptide (TPR) repeat protein